MPNIILVGFEQNITAVMIDNIIPMMNNMGYSGEAKVTIKNASTKKCHKDRSKRVASPYIIVRDTDPEIAENIAKKFNDFFMVDVEYEVIAGFLYGKRKKIC